MSIPQALSDRSLLRLQITALILGVGLMAVKFLAWYRTGSNAILSDALESIINVVAGAFGLYSLLISFRPKDQNHPYGHGKVEFLSAGFEGALISIAGVLILGKAVYNLFYPQELESLRLGIYLTAFTGAANYLMGWVLEWKGMHSNSLILKSSGKHLQADAWSSLGILLGLALVFSTGINQLDNLLAMFFGLLIIYSGFGLVRQSIAGIMDEADYRLIRSIVNHLQQNRSENWVDIHNLRVIKYGPNLHIDCHLTLPWYLNTQDAHAEVKALESLARNFQNHPVEWFIHVDPCEPTSCYLCAKKDCSERKEPFREQVAWTLENVMNNAPHDLPNRTPMPLQGQNA